MTNIEKPINIKKYPLIEQYYKLVREIDALPASTEATFLVVKAGELMKDLWTYFENHQPKSKLSGLLQEKLEAEYKGKRIRNPYRPHAVFLVDYVEVTPEGPDPQMNVLLASFQYQKAAKAWKEWQLKNNPTGEKTPPPELKTQWETYAYECFSMANVDDVLPEVVDIYFPPKK